MSANLELDELRSQLRLHGLNPSGTKRILLQRLDAALRKEGNAGYREERISSPVLGKRKKNSEGGSAERVDDSESIRKMGVRGLREQAEMRGISTEGGKRELLERILSCLECEKKSFSADLAENTVEKLVTATKKCGIVLDHYLPENIKSSYHVLQKGNEVYDAMLNQTNVCDNNNKFYAIQVLESDDAGKYMVYFRWGRVGAKGQDKLLGPYISLGKAISEFEMKFLAKTKNEWSERGNFVSYPNHYTWLEMDYSEGDEHTVKDKTLETSAQLRKTKLECQTAEFISFICNISMMKQQMVEIGYNAEKLPLGKISKSTILKGYEVLKRISDVIGQAKYKELARLSGEFYTVIPHNFGFKKMYGFIIDTPSKLKCKLEMVEALAEIEIASKMLKDDISLMDDPLLWHYQQLQCEMTPLEADSKEFSMIKKYALNTHAKTHSNYTVNIVHIFKVSRPGEFERFKKFATTKNRMLLWHGSRFTNWVGILSQGLRIAPPEAPSTGYMFGKGVYFADMFSKSANYCYATPTFSDGVLLLCEVALGDMEEKLSADYDAGQLSDGKSSVKGVGATEPDPSEFDALGDGAVVPLGKPKEHPDRKGDLLYNEYIVYDVERILMRYVVHVCFKFKS